MTSRWIPCALAAIVLACAAAPASAGTYVHYSCHSPNGDTLGTEGWKPDIGYSGQPLRPDFTSSRIVKSCDLGPAGTLLARLNASEAYEINRRSAWVYVAAPGTTIARIRAWGCRSVYDSWGNPDAGIPAWTTRAVSQIAFPGDVVTGPDSKFRVDGHVDNGCHSELDPGSGYLNPADLWDSGGIAGGTPQVWFEVTCPYDSCSRGVADQPGAPCPSDYCTFDGSTPVAGNWNYAAAATLEDTSAPQVTTVSGALTSSGEHSGVEQLTWSATDTGGGVYRAKLEAQINGIGDWFTLATAPAAGGSCTDAGFDNGNDYEFTTQVPCPASVTNSTLSLDTSKLPVGTHRIRATVEDAAGNTAPLIEPRAFTVKGDAGTRIPASASSGTPVATNGIGATTRALLKVSKASRTIRYGSRATITGRLVDENDAPIAGAVLTVDHRTYRPKTGLVGPSWTPLGQVTTSKAGTFKALIPAGASRALRIVYRASLTQDFFTATAETRLIVRAGVSFAVKRGALHRGQAAVFTGRVRGAVPKAGVLVTLQGYDGSRSNPWAPVKTPVTRTDASGRFRFVYRFQQRYPNLVRFRFRVLVNGDSGFSYASATSQALVVTVSPHR